MPYSGEHAARITSPINDGIFARKTIAPGISIILQKPKGEANTPMNVQSYRFSKDQFTAEEAKAWLKQHKIGIISFEPASEPSKKEARRSYIHSIAETLAGSLLK